MKKLFLFFILLFLPFLFPAPAHAQDVYNFIASNTSYDPTTSNLSFDISNVQHGPIDWSRGMQIVIYDQAGYYAGETFYGSQQFSNLSQYCTATHCSVTLYHSPGEGHVVSSTDVNIIVYGNAYNGVPAWLSQNFKFGCIEPSTNTSPQVNPFSGAAILSGDTYSANSSFAANNPSATSWTAMIDYGDRVSGLQPLTLSGSNFSLSNIYSSPGTYTVTACVVDDQGGVGKSSTTVTVNDPLPPSIGTISVGTNPVQINNATTATASFTDPAGGSSDAATWDWGDGYTSSGTVAESNGAGSITDNHVYTTSGVYTINLTVTNPTNGQSTIQTYQYVSVYNPTSQGLFSAGQHFSSPQGAYTQNSSLTGNVKFGLSYKYQGAMPVGDKQFTMNLTQANLAFNATSVSSLITSNGIGTLRGTGTINGAGTYTFLVTGDDSANTIRIQIKDQSGNVIYDTQPGAADTAAPTTPVTGNIIVH